VAFVERPDTDHCAKYLFGPLLRSVNFQSNRFFSSFHAASGLETMSVTFCSDSREINADGFVNSTDEIICSTAITIWVCVGRNRDLATTLSGSEWLLTRFCLVSMRYFPAGVGDVGSILRPAARSFTPFPMEATATAQLGTSDT